MQRVFWRTIIAFDLCVFAIFVMVWFGNLSVFIQVTDTIYSVLQWMGI